MRILLVDGAPFFGGQARHVYDIARGLDRRDFEVTVAYRHPQLGDALRSANVSCYELPFRAGFDALTLKMLHKLIRREHFDVVHTHGVRAGLLGRLAGRLEGHTKLVHTVHTMAEDLVRGGGAMASLHKRVYRFSDNKLASFTDKIITVSDDLRRRSMDSGIAGGKLVTIHSGVDLSQYETLADKGHARGKIGVPKECRLIGTVARFTPQKNLVDFLRVAKMVSREMDDAMFVLVGDGPEAERLHAEVYRLGISHKTVFTGFQRNIAKVIPAFDVFVLSSLWEGHPLSVLEAMAAGVPVATYQVTGIAETLVEDETGYSVPQGDVQGLADAALRLLSDPAKAEAMGQAGRQRAISQFGLERMVREIEQVYVSLFEHSVYRQTVEVC